eukprot:858245-Amphidinium_carterae.1
MIVPAWTSSGAKNKTIEGHKYHVTDSTMMRLQHSTIITRLRISQCLQSGNGLPASSAVLGAMPPHIANYTVIDEDDGTFTLVSHFHFKLGL